MAERLVTSALAFHSPDVRSSR